MPGVIARYRKLPLFPFAFALYPVLALAAGNRGEYSTQELLLTCVIQLAFTAICFAVLLLAPSRRALMGNTALLLCAFLAWLFLAPSIELTLAGSFREAPRLGYLFRFRYAAAASLIAFLSVGLLLWRSRREHATLLRIARVLSVVLLVGSAGLIGWDWASGGTRALNLTASPSKTGANTGRLTLGSGRSSDPDIYILILDQYANSKILNHYLGFDNRTFESELKGLGFQIPSEVHSNYAWTSLSLSSLLNATYIDSIARAQGPDGRDVGPLYTLIRSNALVASLKRRGYRYFLLPSREFPGTFDSPLADEIIPLHSTSVVRQRISRSTLLFHLVSGNSVARVLARFGWGIRVRDYEMRLAPEIKEIVGRPGPKLVLAHFMLTHDPFYFDAGCRPLSGYALAPAQSRDAYLASLQCTNMVLRDLVPFIVRESRRPTVIVLQGDHGTQTRLPLGPVSEVTADAARERFGAFGAYYFSWPVTALPDTVSAVNVFPLVLNRAFGSRIELLPDQTEFSTLARPFALVKFAGDDQATVNDRRPNRSH
jgi:hypothetical protein